MPRLGDEIPSWAFPPLRTPRAYVYLTPLGPDTFVGIVNHFIDSLPYENQKTKRLKRLIQFYPGSKIIHAAIESSPTPPSLDLDQLDALRFHRRDLCSQVYCNLTTVESFISYLQASFSVRSLCWLYAILNNSVSHRNLGIDLCVGFRNLMLDHHLITPSSEPLVRRYEEAIASLR